MMLPKSGRWHGRWAISGAPFGVLRDSRSGHSLGGSWDPSGEGILERTEMLRANGQRRHIGTCFQGSGGVCAHQDPTSTERFTAHLASLLQKGVAPQRRVRRGFLSPFPILQLETRLPPLGTFRGGCSGPHGMLLPITPTSLKLITWIP